MNNRDVFESFDMNELDDMLIKEEDGEKSDQSSASSYTSTSSYSFMDMLPVYRSMDVLPDVIPQEFACSHMFESSVECPEPPLLQKEFVEPPLLSSESIKKNMFQSQPEPVDDLFALLNEELAHHSLPCREVEVCGLARTSVEILETNVESIISSVLLFLQAQEGLHFDHIEKCSLWKCEMTNFVDSCKYHIQIYSCPDDESKFVVEFLRISGCSLLFSSQYQSFKSQTEGAPMKLPLCSVSDVSSLAPNDRMKSQKALEAFVNWVASGQSEATEAVCGLYANTSMGAKKVTGEGISKECDKQLNPEEIMVMTLLGATCLQYKQESSGGGGREKNQLPMLSLLHLLLHSRAEKDPTSTSYMVLTALVDALLPPTARLTACSHSNKCVKETAIQLMEMNYCS